jgi:hypothetical protein
MIRIVVLDVEKREEGPLNREMEVLVLGVVVGVARLVKSWIGVCLVIQLGGWGRARWE